MPRNDPTDLQPPIKYKTWRAARPPLTSGEIKAAADRAEARAMQTEPMDSPNLEGLAGKALMDLG